MPSSRSAPNRRCAVPGTPIMPAPSRFTSAIPSIVVMPFTSGFGAVRSWISVPGLSARTCSDPDRDALLHRRRHRLRVDDLGAEVREFHRLVVRELVDDLRFRHEARIGAQHAVDVGPDDDLRGVEQRAEDRGREVAAVAAERRLQALDVGRDEAGDDQGADEIRRHQAVQVRARLLPADARAHRPPLDQQCATGVDPLHVPRRQSADPQQPLEHPGGPDLAEAGDQVAHGRRGGPDQPDRLQDAGDVAAVAVEDGDELVVELPGEQFAGEIDVPLAQFADPVVEGRVVLLRQSDQAQQGVGDASASRQDDGFACRRIGLDDRRDPLHAVGVRDTRPAELVDLPGLHDRFARYGHRRTRPAPR